MQPQRSIGSSRAWMLFDIRPVRRIQYNSTAAIRRPGKEPNMSSKLSRRTVLQAALAAGVGVTAAARAASERGSRLPVKRRPASMDPYEDMLRRHGGELGGQKTPR